MSISTFVPASLVVYSLISAIALAQNCATPAGPSDQIVFRNGDVLTGRALSVTPESIGFENQAIGRIVISRDVVAEVKSVDRLAIISSREDAHASVLPFHKAVMALVDGQLSLKLDARPTETVFPGSGLAFENQPWPQTSPTPPTPSIPQAQSRRPPSTLQVNKSGWSLNVLAPDLITLGTENQETLGGIFTFDLYEGSQNHSRLAVSGTHDKTWEIGSPFVATDVLDSFLEQSHSFGPNRGGIYGKVEMFFNTSLGMALQKSFGAGYYSRTIPKGALRFNWSADARYFNQRLYGGSTSDLVGSRLEGQVTYRNMDSTDRSKVKYSIISRTWINPMWKGAVLLHLRVKHKFSIG